MCDIDEDNQWKHDSEVVKIIKIILKTEDVSGCAYFCLRLAKVTPSPFS